MAEIINLNRARKAKARADGEKTAAENRVKFGRSKAEKQAAAAEAARLTRLHDQTRLEGAAEKSLPPASDAEHDAKKPAQ